jgi:hypothetical protein
MRPGGFLATQQGPGTAWSVLMRLIYAGTGRHGATLPFDLLGIPASV